MRIAPSLGVVRTNADTIRQARFDLIWLPPPSFAGDNSAGYNPQEYFNLNNCYGDIAEHRALLEALLTNGVEPVADIVINHRAGRQKCAAFSNPAYDEKGSAGH